MNGAEYLASPSASLVTVLLSLLLFTTFVKTATVLSIARYGIGLIGIEFGVVCLVVALGLSLIGCPKELTSLGFPEAIFDPSKRPSAQAVVDGLVPYMRERIDPSIAEHFKASAQATEGASELRRLAPTYLLSELKSAFKIGCMILVPFVAIDLLLAHLLALLGVRQISAQTVALPLKILVFIVSGGWGLLGKKLLGLE
jgi:type III secretory pathway component EscR